MTFHQQILPYIYLEFVTIEYLFNVPIVQVFARFPSRPDVGREISSAHLISSLPVALYDLQNILVYAACVIGVDKN